MNEFNILIITLCILILDMDNNWELEYGLYDEILKLNHNIRAKIILTCIYYNKAFFYILIFNLLFLSELVLIPLIIYLISHLIISYYMVVYKLFNN